MWLKRLFARTGLRENPMKASEALFHHVNGTGTGYEVDDLVHWSPTPEQEEKAIAPLMEINRQYGCAEYPLGVGNPAAQAAIRALAEQLKSEGL